MYICKNCYWHGESDQLDVKRWETRNGDDEEILFCPDCGSEDVDEVEEGEEL